MKKIAIDIALFRGGKHTVGGYESIPGLGIHHTLSFAPDLGTYDSYKSWAVTHICTGRLVLSGLKLRRDAVALCGEIGQLVNWAQPEPLEWGIVSTEVIDSLKAVLNKYRLEVQGA